MAQLQLQGGDLRIAITGSEGQTAVRGLPTITLLSYLTSCLLLIVLAISAGTMLHLVPRIWRYFRQLVFGGLDAEYLRMDAEEEAQAIEGLHKFVPELRISRIYTSTGGGTGLVITGERLFLDAEMTIAVTSVAKEMPLRAQRKARLIHGLNHELYHQIIGEAKLASWLRTALPVCSFLAALVLGMEVVSAIDTADIAIFVSHAVIVTLAFAYMTHGLIANVEVFNELRADGFAKTQCGEYFELDDRNLRHPVLDRAYPKNHELHSYLETGLSTKLYLAAATTLSLCTFFLAEFDSFNPIYNGSAPNSVVAVLQVFGLVLAGAFGRTAPHTETKTLKGLVTMSSLALAPVTVFASLELFSPSSFEVTSVIWAAALGMLAFGPAAWRCYSAETSVKENHKMATGWSFPSWYSVGKSIHDLGRYISFMLACALLAVVVLRFLDPRTGTLSLDGSIVALTCLAAGLMATRIYPRRKAALAVETLSASIFTVVFSAAAGLVRVAVSRLSDEHFDANRATVTGKLLIERPEEMVYRIANSPELSSAWFSGSLLALATTLPLVLALAVVRLHWLKSSERPRVL